MKFNILLLPAILIVFSSPIAMAEKPTQADLNSALVRFLLGVTPNSEPVKNLGTEIQSTLDGFLRGITDEKTAQQVFTDFKNGLSGMKTFANLSKKLNDEQSFYNGLSTLNYTPKGLPKPTVKGLPKPTVPKSIDDTLDIIDKIKENGKINGTFNVEAALKLAQQSINNIIALGGNSATVKKLFTQGIQSLQTNLNAKVKNINTAVDMANKIKNTWVAPKSSSASAQPTKTQSIQPQQSSSQTLADKIDAIITKGRSGEKTDDKIMADIQTLLNNDLKSIVTKTAAIALFESYINVFNDILSTIDDAEDIYAAAEAAYENSKKTKSDVAAFAAAQSDYDDAWDKYVEGTLSVNWTSPDKKQGFSYSITL